MKNELVIYEAVSGGEIVLSQDIVIEKLCPKAKDYPHEIEMFLSLCLYQKLNPFLREVYLVPYWNKEKKKYSFSMVTGKETFTKRAENHPQYDGFKAGIICLARGELIYRDGSFKLTSEEEELVGGWAEIYRKDHSIPTRAEVSMEEYNQGQSLWKSKPATMIRKVALVQALREAFPGLLGGMYDSAEMPVDVTLLPTTPVGVPKTEKAKQTAPSGATETTGTPAKDGPEDGGKFPNEEEVDGFVDVALVEKKLTEANNITHRRNVWKKHVVGKVFENQADKERLVKLVVEPKKPTLVDEITKKFNKCKTEKAFDAAWEKYVTGEIDEGSEEYVALAKAGADRKKELSA